MKKSGLLLILASSLLLTGCDFINDLKSVINELSFDEENSQEESEETSQAHDTSEQNSKATSSVATKTNEEIIVEKILSYTNDKGFSAKGNCIAEFECAGYKHIYYMKNKALEVYYDFSGAQAYQYIKSDDAWFKSTYGNNEVKGLTTAFSSAITLFNALSDSSDYTITSTTNDTFIGLAGKAYVGKYEYSKTFYNKYEWFVSDKDNFTLRAKASIVNNDEETPVYDYYASEVKYSCTLTLPTNFTEIEA